MKINEVIVEVSVGFLFDEIFNLIKEFFLSEKETQICELSITTHSLQLFY